MLFYSAFGMYFVVFYFLSAKLIILFNTANYFKQNL